MANFNNFRGSYTMPQRYLTSRWDKNRIIMLPLEYSTENIFSMFRNIFILS